MPPVLVEEAFNRRRESRRRRQSLGLGFRWFARGWGTGEDESGEEEVRRGEWGRLEPTGRFKEEEEGQYGQHMQKRALTVGPET